MTQLSIPLPAQPRPGRKEHRPTYEAIRFLRQRGFTVHRQGRLHCVDRRRVTTWELKRIARWVRERMTG